MALSRFGDWINVKTVCAVSALFALFVTAIDAGRTADEPVTGFALPPEAVVRDVVEMPIEVADAHAHVDAVAPDDDNLEGNALWVAQYVSRSYRIDPADAMQYTQWAIEIGKAKDIDPLLILAVSAVESSFKPTARSGAGAEGLMQVMTRVHLDKFQAFGGAGAALQPYPNMVVGSEILRALIKRTGSVSKALKWYSGAANHSSDYGYGAKVLKERSRLVEAASGRPDRAVSLLREKRHGSHYQAGAQPKELPYAKWTSLKAAQAKSDGDLPQQPIESPVL